MKSRQPLLVIVVSALAHLAVLIVMGLTPKPEIDVEPQVIALSLVPGPGRAMARQPAPSQPPRKPRRIRPLTPPDITPQYVDFEIARPAPLARDPTDDPISRSVAAAGLAGQTCQLTGWLQTALQVDPQVQAALSSIPRPARSVANALMLWDGDWVASSPRAEAGVSAVEAAVIAGVRAAPAVCREQVIRGPELMTLAVGVDATVIAIGSGEWRWADLLARTDVSPDAAPPRL